jgi:hypothetical protein
MKMEETGWVIEHGASEQSYPTYWGGVHGWTRDNLKAVRFSREEDARSQAEAMNGDGAEIEAIRADLAAWSAGKPKAIQRAAANLDGWLEIASAPETHAGGEVDVLACTERAVETLRNALMDASRPAPICT